ncbi:MAG: hypothetical protein JRH20_23860 [Deltaproteobacteria bacterium]|nr:hypothetical protein [Deltaproteobacteria bacterium]
MKTLFVSILFAPILFAPCLVGCMESIEHVGLDGAATSDATIFDALAEGTSGDALAAGDASGATLAIYIKGDGESRTFDDGSVGQTPKSYTMGLGRFDIMMAADDPSPVTVFDHGASPVDVDMLGETLGGRGRLADLPPGSYTHGRVLLTKATVKIAALVHAAGVAVPGDLDIVVALSDTTLSGQAWTKGQATFSFAGVTVPGAIPPLPTTGGGSIIEAPGETWLVFAFPEPIVVSSDATTDHRATIVYGIFESFRWKDLEEVGYQARVFDVDPIAFKWEPVSNFGATGYSITLD